MFHGSERLAVLGALLCFGGTGLTLAATGAGLPYLLAAAGSAGLAGVALWAALRQQPPPDRSAELALQAQLEAQLGSYRAATAVLRHDLRGVLSPALMMSDRLVSHQDPSVQRAGQAVVRSIERATALLANHREALTADAPDTPAP